MVAQDGASATGSGREKLSNRIPHTAGAAPHPAPQPRKTVNLALQGGGAHGAFTWGVLDKLLEDGRLDFDGVSGTSAGAINGALLAYGLASGGPDGARELLERLWRRLAKANAFGPLSPSWLSAVTGNPHLDAHPVYAGLDLMVRMMSPYQFNPLGLNPLRDALRGLVDFDVLRRVAAPRLFVSATNVTQGRLKVFQGQELSADCLVASACLPLLFQAVDIDGEQYWDGGYMGNPTLHPLIHDSVARDLVIIQVTPIARPGLPTTPTAIVDRINEISFNSTYLRELRAMELVNRLIDQGKMTEEEAGLTRFYLHRVAAEDAMAQLGVSSKLNADWGFLTTLRDLGRAAAAAWLDSTYDRLGVQSTFDVGGFLV